MGRIRVGEARGRPDGPSHVDGVQQGNARGGYERQVGHHADGTADARRSTGILPAARDPISNTMPNIPPG